MSFTCIPLELDILIYEIFHGSIYHYSDSASEANNGILIGQVNGEKGKSLTTCPPAHLKQDYPLSKNLNSVACFNRKSWKLSSLASVSEIVTLMKS